MFREHLRHCAFNMVSATCFTRNDRVVRYRFFSDNFYRLWILRYYWRDVLGVRKVMEKTTSGNCLNQSLLSKDILFPIFRASVTVQRRSSLCALQRNRKLENFGVLLFT